MPPVHAFVPQQFDLLISQLGIMFFDDPVHAFANLYGALRPGARLRIACFRSLTENDWFSVPLAAARKVVNVPPPGNLRPRPDRPRSRRSGPRTHGAPRRRLRVDRPAPVERAAVRGQTPPGRRASPSRVGSLSRAAHAGCKRRAEANMPPSQPPSKKRCATAATSGEESNSAPASGSSAPAHGTCFLVKSLGNKGCLGGLALDALDRLAAFTKRMPS